MTTTQHMLRVDKLDQFSAYYSFLHKSVKWWRKVFFWMLEVTVINSYIIYKKLAISQRQWPIKHSAYRRALTDHLSHLCAVMPHRQLDGVHQPLTTWKSYVRFHTTWRIEGSVQTVLSVVIERQEEPGICHYTTVQHAPQNLPSAPHHAFKLITHKETFVHTQYEHYSTSFSGSYTRSLLVIHSLLFTHSHIWVHNLAYAE